MTAQELNLDFVDFPDNQYYTENFDKSQVFLHHTAGNSNPYNVFKYVWAPDEVRVATCVTVGGLSKDNKWKDGQIVQGFSSKYWAYHLGLKSSVFKEFNLPYKSLDKTSIGVEICNWGWVTETDKGWATWAENVIDESEVVELSEPFKGRRHYQKYTDAQIESVRKLLLFWNERYNIPVKKISAAEIFGISENALKGEPGVYTHNSVRHDKWDVYPYPPLIQMLESL